ncbi:MAG: holo-ACP synthase [Gammaproteobacteria bacterium]|nr:holo-ACP synthase [Gammaproteobacteria bacterium]NIR85432.1 holo-ACP synthase [Gammaproteobacteria bacterium]NIU06568.1 holo-ACP synthase [Gammaproteobacteria bacterium]NIV74651.1 holo-ACP synthase [Gammaproteobacteria bacterium]NIX87841.1 holo-ACP synthase [Gammaproteobacteria bacterium]
MIVGVGTDIVRVARMEANLQRHGERFARRVLSPEELEEFRNTTRGAQFLAKRFAAKEAAVKAMGRGFTEGLTLREIATAHDRRGRPELTCRGRAAELLEQLGVTTSYLSVADEEDYAIAFVVLWC